MLFGLTAGVDFFAMAITLWLGFYLFAKSFPHPIAMRAVVMLVSLSIFFFGAFFNLFHQFEGTAAWRAVLLIVSLGTWHNLTCQLMSARDRARQRWWAMGIYALGASAAFLLLSTSGAFKGEQGNQLYVAHMGSGLPYSLYGAFQIIASVSLLYNLLVGDRVGTTPLGRYFLLGSVFPILGTTYGVYSLISPAPMPRLIQDFLSFSGVFLIGAAVARHQALVERRIALPDFPITGISVIALSGLYAALFWALGYDPEEVAFMMAMAIFTHSIYDFVHESLDRLRLREENDFRKKMQRLENQKIEGQSLELRLKIGLGLLTQTLRASGAFIAMREGEDFVVKISRNSLPVESRLAAALAQSEDLRAAPPELPKVSWLAPIFNDQGQAAVLGLGNPRARLDYPMDDLELLSEVADRLGILITLNETRLAVASSAALSEEMAEVGAVAFDSSADELLNSMANNPDANLVKCVEEDLRHLGDYSLLSGSALASQLNVPGATHLERGKALHGILVNAIDMLRPAGARPKEPLPRLWYSYAVLHDAYVEGVPNREIMSRLYISEGTFNRTRRNALRSLARQLLETAKAA